MKKILIITGSIIVILVSINIILWQTYQINTLKKEIATIKDEKNIEKNIIDNSEEVIDVIEVKKNKQENLTNQSTNAKAEESDITSQVEEPIKKSVEPMDEWQVYRNRDLRFDIKFPHDWRYIDRHEQGVMFGPKEIKEDTLLTIVVLDEMPQVGDVVGNSRVVRVEDSIFAYRPAKRIFLKNLRTDMETSRIITQKNGKIISIGEATLNDSDYPFSHEYNQTINKIIATFRFLE